MKKEIISRLTWYVKLASWCVKNHELALAVLEREMIELEKGATVSQFLAIMDRRSRMIN